MLRSVTDQTTELDPGQARVNSDDLAQMAHDCFHAMLGIPFDSAPREPANPAPTAIESSIEISGDWNAEVRVIASADLASQIACAMFDVDADEISNCEIHDAMGEIVNVIGGNAKGIVDADCQLSLPCVGEFTQLHENPTLFNTFTCLNSPISIQLIEQA